MYQSDNPLLTDLYQFTMLQSYLEHGLESPAVFEFYSRKLPEPRNFLVAAGLEQVLTFLENLTFGEQELEWLQNCGRFKQSLVDYLAEFRFTGDVHAMAEGTVFFPDEPILRVTAPLPMAQLVETRIINILHYQILVASKAARMHLIAPEKLLVDFGLRRAHGAEAGLMAARASYLAGFAGTSTVQAALAMEIPIFGTMAHSYILAHDDEMSAFENFARSYPQGSTLLIDTYDTEAAAQKVVELVQRLEPEGITIRAVRLDSGDLGEHAHKVREILDAGNCAQVQIFASGNLDEYALQELKHASIDGFGVGTRLDTSADLPYLDCAYKLQEYGGLARRKLSEGKANWPGRKQVFRYCDVDGRFSYDLLTVEGDNQSGDPLIHKVMASGHRIENRVPLAESREYCLAQLQKIPLALSGLEKGIAYPVEVSNLLRRLVDEVDSRPH